MVSSGIKAIRSYSFLSKEIGGANNVGFLRRDCHNFLHTKRKQLIEAGDGQSVINHSKNRQNEDSMLLKNWIFLESGSELQLLWKAYF